MDGKMLTFREKRVMNGFRTGNGLVLKVNHDSSFSPARNYYM